MSKKVIQLLLCTLLGASTVCFAQDTTPFFELDHRIVLGEDVLISSIRSLKILPNGQLLLIDTQGSQVVVIDRNGALVKNLDPADCHPGFELRPIGVAVNAKYIFLTNSSPWGYVFNSDESCYSAVDVSFRPSFAFTFVSDSLLAGIYHVRGERPHIQWFDQKGAMLEKLDFPETDFPNADHRMEAGGILSVGDDIWWAPPISHHLFRIRDGKIQDFDPTVFYDLGHPSEDIPEVLNPSLFKKVGQILKEARRNEGVFLLPDGKLLLQYHNPGDGTIRVIADPDNLKDFRIEQSDFVFLEVHGEFAYAVGPPELNEDGSDTNYVIDVYRYVGYPSE